MTGRHGEGLEKRLEKGRKEERAKAEAEKLADKQNSARKMLKSSFDVDMISDILGLSIAEIEKLK
ncbi:hypothetical protein EWE74_12975 [Sphingobacterium corticibacterium]|uniref:Transposase n=1 Tax=Sphingobacterium corticibacterium TaxID=2484746 RepID=A0A4Q6XSP6_9SPHI|nr:hypothetical protein EWE74_12975 [Sphingobacterium corticibacterium]